MQAILPRPQNLSGSGSTPAPRVPRRSTSFLSLRQKQKDKSSPPAESNMTWDSSLHGSPPTYLDAYPRSNPPTKSHSSKSKIYGGASSSKALSRLENLTSHYGVAESFYTFPTSNSSENIAMHTQHPRVRSSTGPSGRPNWKEVTSIPKLRFSGSSSTHRTETPPRTPIDPDHVGGFEIFPVVVAAPVAGVETMDALVDGMNGGDDIISHTTSLSNRARFGIPGHHPLYQPPLPSPPPGVILGGGKIRRPKRHPVSAQSSDTDDDDGNAPVSIPRPRPRPHRSPSRMSFNSNVTPVSTSLTQGPDPSVKFWNPRGPRKIASDHELQEKVTSIQSEPIKPWKPEIPVIPRKINVVEKSKTVIPSISEIIRAHAPPEAQVRSRPSTSRSSSYYAHSQGHSTVHEELEPEPEPVTLEEEASLLSRSSIDSVADEVQRTLRSQIPRPAAAPPSSFLNRRSTFSDNVSMDSPRSDPGAASLYASSINSNLFPSSPFDGISQSSSIKPSTASQEVAKYLHSTKLTTLLRLTRSPHASTDNPLVVSLSDLGSPQGYPVVVFLGLGCVRHIMGLYDEMAEIMNLRLITIDRWGLGRTEPRSKSAKGIMQWASVVEEVLDLLHIGRCSIMAHSAGAPYALSFANKVPGRICGDICLLAPWVGGSESNGYKWLKYVPNGILKTAQAAEWKIQAWMIGKPPTIAYEGIGYNAHPTIKPSSQHLSLSPKVNGDFEFDVLYPSPNETRPRPSIGSSTFSEYDDLKDFDGRFESRSTLGAGATHLPSISQGDCISKTVNKRKASRGFLNRLKSSSSPQSLTEEKPLSSGKRLKALRSMGSLKGRSTVSKKSDCTSPQLPPSPQFEVGLGFGELEWPKNQSEFSVSDKDGLVMTPRLSTNSNGVYGRNAGRRSISFTSPRATLSMPSSPTSTANSSYVTNVGLNSAYQAALGNALIAASHAESANGTHNDLLQILNHDNHPWGFSYSSYPHRVKVWYGDKDEKIAENAVRWMAKNMGEDRCSIKVVRGADHGMMYRSSVVVEVLEHVSSFWKLEI